MQVNPQNNSCPVYSDVRILDFTQFQQGPVGTQFLADFGAEVIKIERPEGGDGFRGSTSTGSMNAVEGGYGPAFVACNRNKKSITLNLKTNEAKQIIHDLVKVSDVVASNFRPGVMEKLGFGFDELSKINPRIICAYASGYGQSGPDRETLGQDMMAQCRAGLVRGNPPHTAGYNIVDQFGGMMLAQGIMLALAAREKTGRGQVVDSSLLNTALIADIMGATAYLNSQHGRPKQEPKPKIPNPTYALYQAKDKKWVHIIDAFRDKPLQRQCKALEIPDEVANDPRFADVHHLTPEAFTELRGQLAAGVARFTADDVIQRFKQQDMMAVKVCDYADVFADPQVLHNEMILEAQHPKAGTVKMTGFPVKLSETPARLRNAPPLLGEHNGEVLGGILGMSPEQIKALYEKKVISKE